MATQTIDVHKPPRIPRGMLFGWPGGWLAILWLAGFTDPMPWWSVPICTTVGFAIGWALARGETFVRTWREASVLLSDERHAARIDGMRWAAEIAHRTDGFTPGAEPHREIARVIRAVATSEDNDWQGRRARRMEVNGDA